MSVIATVKRTITPAASDGSTRALVATAVALVATITWITAHEGHDTALRPVYRQTDAGGTTYRIGFAMAPTDVLVGEDARFEIQVLQMPEAASGPGPGRPLPSADVTVRIISTGSEPYTLPHVGPGEKPGTYTARHRFTDSGQYAVAVNVKTADRTTGAEFPVVVGAGPVLRTALVVDGIVLLVLGALVFSRWRARSAAAPGTVAPLTADLALVAAGIATLVVGHTVASPRIGRLLLPERHFGTVAWDMGAPPGVDPAAAPAVPDDAPHTHPPGTPPHTHPKKSPGGGDAPTDSEPGAHEIVSTVVAVPGQITDVMVPASARVLFDVFAPRVGRTVRRGQTIATLEYNYIEHDAVHLVNQRWLYLVPMLASKRASLEADLTAARTRHLARNGEPSIQQAMQVMQAVESAELAASTARLEQQRAQKLLAMHTAQINESDLVRRPIVAPIDGTLEAVNFTHGQLAYENDKLFTILDGSRVWIEVRFPETAASRRPPATMRFASPAFPSVQFEGRLARIANTLDPATGTLSVFYEVPNPNRLLRVGMRVSAQRTGQNPEIAGGMYDVRKTGGPGAVDFIAPTGVSLPAIIKPSPELTAAVTAPLWGRIEFAGRRLNVGDHVTKGEDLVHIILELAADERYQMNARAVDIAAERELARTRREQAEKRWKQAVQLLEAHPADSFRKEESQLLERIYEGAKEEEALLVKQVDVYKDVIKRRDPKTTIVKAPISGVITDVGFRPGELNGTDEFRRLFTIVNTSRVWLEAQMYEHQSAAILKGFTRASFVSPGSRTTHRLDRPVAVSGALNPDTGALSVIFDVANPGGALKIGGSAQVVVVPHE